MSQDNPARATASGQGSATVRQRPHLLLMVTRLRTAESTLEQGLTKLKAKAEATAHLLRRLGAVRVETGEPHFDDQTDKDPLTAIQTRTAQAFRKRTPGEPPGPPPRGTNVVLTAAWPIDSLTADETLVLVDRLRFELAEDTAAAGSGEPPPPWASPEEQVLEMMAQIHQPPDELAPQFLFVAAASDEQREKAAGEAFARARRQADTVARAAGYRLGAIASIHGGFNPYADIRPDRMMDRQRCGALLRGSSYAEDEYEVITDRPQSTEFAITLNVSYHLEAADRPAPSGEQL